MDPVFPVVVWIRGEPDVRFVNDRSGRKRMALALVPHKPGSQSTQVRINQRDELGLGAPVTLPDLLKKTRDLARTAPREVLHDGFCS